MSTPTAANKPRMSDRNLPDDKRKPALPKKLPGLSGRFEEEIRFRPISFKLIVRLSTWLKPYRSMYMIGAFCGILAVGVDLCGPQIIQHIIDLVSPGKKAEPGAPPADWDAILHWSYLWCGVVAGSLFLEAMQLLTVRKAGERVVRDMRKAVFDHLQRLTMSFYDRTKLGSVITRCTSDLDSQRDTVINGVNTIVVSAVQMVGAGFLMAYTDWHLFVSVAWLAIVVGVCNNVYRKKIGEAWQIVRAGYSRMAANLAENITGVRVVNAFNRQEENLEYFNQLQDANQDNNLHVANINGFYLPLLEFMGFAGRGIILAYGGVRALEGAITVGQVMAVFFYWETFMRPTINLGNFYNSLMQAMASCERIFALLDEKPGVEDARDAKPCERLQGSIRFEKVLFGYDPLRPVLKGASFEIPAGKTYALVGHTGSGKSTILSLMARFYEFQQGKIFVDGKDIRSIQLHGLHKQMGLVLQVNYLFTGSIIDNIRYPRPEASDEEVYEAARQLGTHDLFMGLADGYKTSVGERGANVSLGLRQLICFTRVLLANPSIFLLDEATSSVDTLTEKRIQNALEKLVQNRTTVIVAHRLSTIVKADGIFVLDHGHLVETGTHAELVEKKGLYAQMYERFTENQENQYS